jgi:hypothetical protein
MGAGFGASSRASVGSGATRSKEPTLLGIFALGVLDQQPSVFGGRLLHSQSIGQIRIIDDSARQAPSGPDGMGMRSFHPTTMGLLPPFVPFGCTRCARWDSALGRGGTRHPTLPPCPDAAPPRSAIRQLNGIWPAFRSLAAARVRPKGAGRRGGARRDMTVLAAWAASAHSDFASATLSHFSQSGVADFAKCRHKLRLPNPRGVTWRSCASGGSMSLCSPRLRRWWG